MGELVIDAGFFNPVVFIEQEELIISTVIDILFSETFDDKRKSLLCEAVRGYSKLLSSASYHQTLHIKIESLLRILRFLIEYPIKNRIDQSIVVSLYGEYELLNMVTFAVFQMSTESIGEDSIISFMDYVKGSYIEKLSAFFLFRLNPDCIKVHYQYDNVYEMTAEELYYGVATGYYRIGFGTNAAIKRLVEMSAWDMIDRLTGDGFWIIV